MVKKARSQHVPLTKVVLYKHGMGYFERCGKVAAPATIDLFCAADAVDDMLKSLLVLNLGGGRTGTITYDSSKTAEMRFQEFGFDIRACRGLLDLIARLKGTPVKVVVSGQPTAGRVIGLDEIEQIVGETTVKDQQLVLYTQENTFRRYSLASISALHVEDEALAAEIQQQLELLFDAAKKKDKKRLQVSIEGTEPREVFIAYSIPSPIWKTSYRLVFVPDGSLLLQGMAIVDNLQDEDWEAVQIVLVSASPISFIQPLYDPIQPSRPTIAPQGIAGSGPVSAERAQKAEPRFDLPIAERARKMALAGAPAAHFAQGAAGATFGGPAKDIAAALQDAFAGEELQVEAEPTGELFEYKIEKPLTVPRNTSALIPLIQQTIEGERLSLYNASKNSKFPYNTVRLKNTTGLTLEAGPVTIMEENAYAGESMLDVIKPDDTRLLPYANDQACHVIVRSDTTRKPIWRVRSSRGIIYMDYREQYKQTYLLENLSERDKVVLVEHPILPGMQLAGGPEPVETTQSHHRFRVELKPREQSALVVTEETEAWQQVRIDDVEAFDTRQVDWLLQQTFIDKAFLEFLRHVVRERGEILALVERKVDLENQIAQFKADQERARENVRALGSSTERFRKAIDEAEDRIMQSSRALTELNNTISDRRRKFSEMTRAELMSELESMAASRV